MPQNLLIYGGYNWLGFHVMDYLIQENTFTDFIIVDSFQNQLWKDNIRDKMDLYRHLYEVHIHLYAIDIKDKYKLESIYKKHNITHVIQNIKYNPCDKYVMEKLNGFKHIRDLNHIYKISQMICLYRQITHNEFNLNHDMSTNHIKISETFNDYTHTIFNTNKPPKISHITIYDYVYGYLKDHYNDIVYKYKKIIQTNIPCYVDVCTFYLTYDKYIIDHLCDLLLNKSHARMIHSAYYTYEELYDTIQSLLNKSSRDKKIKDNPVLIQYICS